jgi:hypothetical protein
MRVTGDPMPFGVVAELREGTGGDRPRGGAPAPASCQRHACLRDRGGRALPVRAHGRGQGGRRGENYGTRRRD